MNRFQPPGPLPALIHRQSDAYPMGPDAADVVALRRVLVASAPGADPDWLSEAEAYGSHAEYLADRAAFDRGDYDDDPFREA